MNVQCKMLVAQFCREALRQVRTGELGAAMDENARVLS